MRKQAFSVLAIVSMVLAAAATGHAQNPPKSDFKLRPQVAKSEDGVDWFFAYKFNTRSFPSCPENAKRTCPFGGDPVDYKSGFGLQYVVASSAKPKLAQNSGCLGETEIDPVGSTFERIYNQSLNFVVWNDQFYADPPITGCGNSCNAPWGHSKGVLAWDDEGNGVVLQVTTPSWPGAGAKAHPRKAGNTLGCVANDPDVLVAQSFFALALSPADTLIVAKALENASVVTKKVSQVFKNGGPANIRAQIDKLGTKSKSDQMLHERLSSGVQILSKPSAIHAPPWHLVSSKLGSINLKVATWWKSTDIPDSPAHRKPGCWPTGGDWPAPGAVVNSAKGHWDTTSFGLLGIGSPLGNHAKIGVSTSGSHPYAIFGDMNQQGALSGKCTASQNGRGGNFFVVEDKTLRDQVEDLISDHSAHTKK